MNDLQNHSAMGWGVVGWGEGWGKGIGWWSWWVRGWGEGDSGATYAFASGAYSIHTSV
jgi:hypothetical protein